MKEKNTFLITVCNIAIPVALQSMLQSSFSIVDQIMIGQLGSVSVAGVGLAGKFSWIFSVLVAAFGTVAGIMIAQYMGQNNQREIRRSFSVNLLLGLVLAGFFTLLCLVIPEQIMRLYSSERETITVAADYLRIMAGTYFPIAGATMLATLFRCQEKASYPLYASIVAALLNTGLNYILIFGKFGAPQLGVAGAAIATVVSQIANFLIMLVLFLKEQPREWMLKTEDSEASLAKTERFNWRQYAGILLPILICEFFWSLGENIYAAIYGHLGTQSCAAMTVFNPVQGMMTGALCGISQAAGVIIGKMLGNEEREEAYAASKKLMWYGLVASAVISLVIFLASPFYVEIYQVEESVKLLARQILMVYVFIAPVKVQNMILGGGIIRSGGKTNFVMVIDMVGTWIFGVPLGLLAAFVLDLSIPYVYLLLSLEECVRYGISWIVFRKKKWMLTIS